MTQEVRKFIVQLHNKMTDDEVLKAFKEQMEICDDTESFTLEVDETMTPEEVLAFNLRVKEEIRKNRLARSSEMGYNPLSVLEDYFFPNDM